MVARQHAGAVQQYRVVQRGAFALADAIELGGDVGQLRQEELVHLQPVGRVGVRQQVVDHVVHPQVGEAQRRVVVVQLQRGDARGVGLETQHHNVAHQPHVLGDVLRYAVFGSLGGRLGGDGLLTLQLAALAGAADAALNLAHAFQVFIQLALVAAPQILAEIARILAHRVEHAFLTLLHIVLEQTVEGQRRVQLQRGGCGRRAPRDVRAVQHGIVLVHRRVGRLAPQHQAGHLGIGTVPLRQHLVDAGARTDLAARSQGRARQEVAGLRAVDVALQGLGIEQAAHKQKLFAMRGEGFEHLAQLYRLAFALGPPFAAVEAVAREEGGETERGALRLGGATGGGGLGVHAPDGE